MKEEDTERKFGFEMDCREGYETLLLTKRGRGGEMLLVTQGKWGWWLRTMMMILRRIIVRDGKRGLKGGF